MMRRLLLSLTLAPHGQHVAIEEGRSICSRARLSACIAWQIRSTSSEYISSSASCSRHNLRQEWLR